MSRRRDDDLTRGLRALADAEADVQTPPHVEAAIMARWDTEHAPRSRSLTRRVVRGAATLAAGITIVGAVALQRQITHVRIAPPASPDAPFRADLSTTQSSPRTVHNEPPTINQPQTTNHEPRTINDPRTLSRQQTDRAEFVLVGEPIAVGEAVQVVRMRVDRVALLSLGISDAGSGDTVDIELLVGEDGVARGVRVSL